MPIAISQLSTALASRYAIEREVGRGGMATVFRARDLRHDRTVALKVLDPELAAILGVERFLSEIRVTARLQHPNLLPLFDSGEANGLPFYVMPYVEGESLRARLERDRQLPVDEAIRITLSVASALEYAHANGVIHRDLKPENILLQAGQPLVADFGIALAVNNAGGTRITQTGLSLGTPQYMSPEQATGDRIVDSRSDIYSLGAVLYEMLTGEPPHSGQTFQAVIALLLTERPRPVRTFRPSISTQVEGAVERALEKLPADRWTSAREFADALQGKTLVSSLRSSPADVTPTQRTWLARLRDPVVLALGALALGGAVIAVWGWSGTPRDDGRFSVRIPITVENPPAEGGWFSAIAISPDGKNVAYARREERVGLWVRSLEAMTARLVVEGGLMPFFSPDGKWLGFRTPTGLLAKVSLSSGERIEISRLQSFIAGAAWANDGVIVVSTNNRLMLLPDEGGTATPFIPLDSASGETGQRNPRVLPDGSTVLYESMRGEGEPSRIGVASLTNARRSMLELPGASPIGVTDGYLIYGSSTGTIMAVRFDVSRRQVEGSPVSVITEADVTPGRGLDAGQERGVVRAALSATGTIVYAAGESRSQVVLADMSGNARVLAEEPRNYSRPRFSRDGKRLIFDIASGEARDVWIRDLASGTTSKLTTDGDSYRAEWHPDGKRVLYVSSRGGGRSQLWMQSADLSSTPELIERAPTRGGAPNFGMFSTADPRFLLMVAGADIFFRNLSVDSVATPFSVTPQSEMAAKFSPDGKWVAYATTGERAIQVFVQPFPPTGARHKVTESGGMTPVWSPKSDKIYYVWAGAIHAASLRTSPEFRVLSREQVFAGDFVLMVPPVANYDISPDGKHFVLLRPVGAGDQLIVVHDWKYELRVRTRADRPK